MNTTTTTTTLPTAEELFHYYTQGTPYASTTADSLDSDNELGRDVLAVILNGGTWDDVDYETERDASLFAINGIHYDAAAALRHPYVDEDADGYDDLRTALIDLMSERDTTDWLMLSAQATGQMHFNFAGDGYAFDAIGARPEDDLGTPYKPGTTRLVVADLARVLAAKRSGFVFEVTPARDY